MDGESLDSHLGFRPRIDGIFTGIPVEWMSGMVRRNQDEVAKKSEVEMATEIYRN